MDIEQKFESGRNSRTYRRIDPEYKVDIFLGYNEGGQLSMVIAEPGKETTVKSSKYISTSLSKRKDGKLSLSFDLLDNAYRSMFMVFCKDVIAVCERAGSNLAISNAITRWKYWKNLFGNRKQNILDSLTIKGLTGELVLLRDYFIDKYGEKDAVNGWMGPLLGHKDFEINDTWYEVKSVSESALQVTISSLEQLSSDNDGHLMVVRLEDTSSVSSLSINLNTLVSDITSMLDDPDLLNLFITRLGNVGFEPDEEYDKYNYIYKGLEIYSVRQGFPFISRNMVPDAVGNVKYTLLLNGISEFREKE